MMDKKETSVQILGAMQALVVRVRGQTSTQKMRSIRNIATTADAKTYPSSNAISVLSLYLRAIRTTLSTRDVGAQEVARSAFQTSLKPGLALQAMSE